MRGNHNAFALGRLRTGQMNATEIEYDAVLDGLKHHGEVAWYKFEGVKLRLADNTFYTPDFFVMLADGTLECREVKGHWQDDARAKIKIAAALYPFDFIAVKKQPKKAGGGFAEERF